MSTGDRVPRYLEALETNGALGAPTTSLPRIIPICGVPKTGTADLQPLPYGIGVGNGVAKAQVGTLTAPPSSAADMSSSRSHGSSRSKRSRQWDSRLVKGSLRLLKTSQCVDQKGRSEAWHPSKDRMLEREQCSFGVVSDCVELLLPWVKPAHDVCRVGDEPVPRG